MTEIFTGRLTTHRVPNSSVLPISSLHFWSWFCFLELPPPLLLFYQWIVVLMVLFNDGTFLKMILIINFCSIFVHYILVANVFLSCLSLLYATATPGVCTVVSSLPFNIVLEARGCRWLRARTRRPIMFAYSDDPVIDSHRAVVPYLFDFRSLFRSVSMVEPLRGLPYVLYVNGFRSRVT